MNVVEVFSGIFKPVADLVDDLTLSKEEKAELQARVTSTLYSVLNSVLGYESKIAEAKRDVLVAEAKSESFLTRNWRPITMLTFLTLIVADSFGLLAFRLSEQAWTLLEIGLGGYVVGRSVEKVALPIVNAFKPGSK